MEADEIIASISTDKIDTDVESPATGRVQEILVEVGTTVEVGTVMARIATDAKPGEPHRAENGQPASPAATGGTASTGSGEAGQSEAAAALEAPGDAGELQGDTAETHAGTAQRAPAEVRRSGPRRYSPVVMRIAAEHGIDLEQVEGTGPRRPRAQAGRDGVPRSSGDGADATRGHKQPPMHIESPYKPDAPPAPRKPRSRLGRDEAPAAPEPPAEMPAGQSGPLSRMRQSIGRAMVESLRTAATCTTIVEADLSRIEAARKQSGLTYLPYIARATIEVLREYPALNATLEGETLTTYDGVHLGVAVSLGDSGLIVPVIRDAQDLSVEGLAARIKDLARRGRVQPALAGRGPRRHVHDHEPRRLRLDHRHAGDQPAAGRDPRHRGRGQAGRGRHRRARQRLDRDPADDLPVHVLGPPGARRGARGAVPQLPAQEAGELADYLIVV